MTLYFVSLVGSCGSTVQAPEPRAGELLRGICKILNNIKDTQVCVSPKDLRDRLKILVRDCKAKKREAERGSGIFQEYREID